MTHQFAGAIFETREQLVEAVAQEFMMAGGINSPDQITDILNDMSDAELADEALDMWTVSGVTHEELIEAIARFRADRPDMND